MLNVLGLGDNVCDIYLHTRTMYPGGQALNFAVYAAQLGAKSSYLGAFGNDAVARHILRALDAFGVSHPRSRHYEEENGYAKVTLVDGDRAFMGSNRGGPLQTHPLALDENDLAYIAGFDLVHTSNNSFLDSELPKLNALPCLVSYDFSGRWNEPDRVDRVSPYVDFAFLSCGSSMAEADVAQICKTIHEKGAGVIVATMGKAGAMLFDGANLMRQPSDSQPAVDSLGAGDSFATCTLLETVAAMKRDPQRWKTDAAYRKTHWKVTLKKATAFATQTCQVNGAFGKGVLVPDEIWNVIINRKEANAP